MAQTFLVFDFGTNEEAAQQARHKFEGWKQAFRLGDKVVLKFDRTADEAAGAEEHHSDSKSAESKSGAAATGKSTGKKNATKKSSESDAEDEKRPNESSNVRILIRLAFSDHEKLSQQRWLDRIPSEEPFKSAKAGTIRHSDASFAKTAELFDSLDRSARQAAPR